MSDTLRQSKFRDQSSTCKDADLSASGPVEYSTDPGSLPEDVRSKILKARDACVVGDFAEAYHQLYSIADPEFESRDPWAKLEGR